MYPLYGFRIVQEQMVREAIARRRLRAESRGARGKQHGSLLKWLLVRPTNEQDGLTARNRLSTSDCASTTSQRDVVFESNCGQREYCVGPEFF